MQIMHFQVLSYEITRFLFIVICCWFTLVVGDLTTDIRQIETNSTTQLHVNSSERPHSTIQPSVTSSSIQKIPSEIEKHTENIHKNHTVSELSSTAAASSTSASPTVSTTTPQEPNEIPSTNLTVEMINVCPPLIPPLDTLTQDVLTTKITDTCRYDRLVKPPTDGPLKVYFQMDMMHIESVDQLQFKSHILVQLRYNDSRLRFDHLSPARGNIMGEEPLRNKIWVPHIVVKNEKDSDMMGLDGKDIIVQITPTGDVIYSYRMTVTFYCWMNLKKFPFDYQICEIRWASWAYNTTSLTLQWEKDNPYQVARNLHLTEFVLDKKLAENTVIPASFAKGGLSGNYSAVIFKFKLRREVGYYIMDYFLPSMLLVFTSWVTFWLQADAAAPRVTLGTATMLSFITLNGGLTKNLPKVSYIKASEIWFLGCTSFIFCSMAEFAFVNVIWRRRKRVELKKQSSKHILKGAITPSLARKQLRKSESFHSLYKARSCSSLDNDNREKQNTQQNYLTVHSFPSAMQIPTIQTQSQDELIDIEDSVTTIPIPEKNNPNGVPPAPTWTTMTPQEVANWIDKKSRIGFPVAFLIFNLLYWSFVYAL